MVTTSAVHTRIMTLQPTIIQDNMNGSISYLKEGLSVNFKRKMFLADGVHMMFDRHEMGAQMYLADHDGLVAPIPAGMRVLRDRDGHDGGTLVNPIGNCFFLSWEHNYDILVNDDLFYRLRKQKQHAVSGPISLAAKRVTAAGTAAEAAMAAGVAAEAVIVAENLANAMAAALSTQTDDDTDE